MRKVACVYLKYGFSMELREFDMSDSETEFLLDPIRDRGGCVEHQFRRDRRKRVRKLGSIFRFACG